MGFIGSTPNCGFEGPPRRMISGIFWCCKSENRVNAALNGFGGHSLLFIATICEHATGSCVVLSIGGLLVFS